MLSVSTHFTWNLSYHMQWVEYTYPIYIYIHIIIVDCQLWVGMWHQQKFYQWRIHCCRTISIVGVVLSVCMIASTWEPFWTYYIWGVPCWWRCSLLVDCHWTAARLLPYCCQTAAMGCNMLQLHFMLCDQSPIYLLFEGCCRGRFGVVSRVVPDPSHLCPLDPIKS